MVVFDTTNNVNTMILAFQDYDKTGKYGRLTWIM